jgi:hypothetical protein
MYPQLVGRVEAMTNAVTNINGVRLWCGHDFPQCAYSVGEIGWSANDVYVQSIDNRQVQAALANLIHMMGGGAAVAEPLSLRVTERLR